MLGARENSVKDLQDAAQECRIALKGASRESDPADWALAEHNLGSALLALGERSSGTRLLDQAMISFNDALKERTKQSSPLDWAATQASLGRVLRILGERKNSPKLLGDAAAAYNNALEIFRSGGFIFDTDRIDKELRETMEQIALQKSKKG